MTADAPTMDFWRVLELVGEQYPKYLPILSQPGVFGIFTQVFTNPGAWSPERIQSAIQQTDYYQNTPVDERTWAVQAATDPATAKRRLDNADLAVRRIAGELGIPPYDLTMVSLQAAANSWDESRIRAELVARLNGSSPLGPGGIGDTITQYHKLAASYGVPLDHTTEAWWAENTLGGSVTAQGFEDFVRKQAMNLYPALKPAIEEGQTVAGYAAPYFTLAAQELGINPNQISLLNPKWMDLVVGSDDKGNQGVLSMNEALQKIRSDPAYGYDQGMPGRTQAAGFATKLLQEFGATG